MFIQDGQISINRNIPLTYTQEQNASYACLLPANHDLNPFCYQCDNQTRAEEIHKIDVLAKEHVLASGACHEHNYSLFIHNDPIFKDVGLYRRDKGKDSDVATTVRLMRVALKADV